MDRKDVPIQKHNKDEDEMGTVQVENDQIEARVARNKAKATKASGTRVDWR